MIAFGAATPARAFDSGGCTPENSERIPFHDAYALNPGTGKCVTLHALLAERSLHGSLQAFYASAAPRPITDPQGGEIGAYATDDLPEPDTLWERRSMVEATGRLTDCAELYEEAAADIKAHPVPGRIVWMQGPCHYRDGPVLVIGKVRFLSEPVRLSGAEAFATYGNLFLSSATRRRVQRSGIGSKR
ncbi:MAG TPA: hypothetical protein VHE09_05290 [Rhizomicrobium sp.]|nr:hypothetical protein [Rhizomicrobium sp.]